MGLPLLLLTGGPLAASGSSAVTDPSTWRTWHLSAADQFRLEAPPSAFSKATKRELGEIRKLQADISKKERRQIKRWHKGAATLPWTNVQLDMIRTHAMRPPFAARALAYLHTAMYDALVAAHDSQLAHGSVRPKPHIADDRIDPRVSKGKRGTSFAPEQAAIAGAAETVLTALFPQEPSSTFEKLADQVVQSRIVAGAAYRSDVESARDLGRRVAEVALQRTTIDGIDNAGFAYERPMAGEERAFPSGDGDPELQWQPAPPNYELPFAGPAGSWMPWLTDDAADARVGSAIPGPYAYGSPEFLAETLEVLEVSEQLPQNPEHSAIAHFWDDPPVATATPPGHWFEIAMDHLKDDPRSTPETARMFALLGTTVADAAIAVFEAKYYWWSIRPIQAIHRLCDGDTRFCTDEEATALAQAEPDKVPYWDEWFPIIDTPAFPSYPGGHSTFSGSSGRLLSYFFPASEGTLNELAEEAAMSRLYGGIHFRSDNDDGLVLGRWVAETAIQWAETDGSGL